MMDEGRTGLIREVHCQQACWSDNARYIGIRME
jgi:hypothetical protein